MKKRVLSWLLALVMLVGLLPMSALAARMETSEVLESPVGEEITAKPAEVPQDQGGAPQSTASTAVTVNFTSQAEGTFLHAPQMGVTVASDLAESCGLADLTDGVSVLDVLVKAHEIAFGVTLTEDTVGDYIEISNGFVTSAFCGTMTSLSFAVNGACPNNGVWNETYNAYTGYAINEAAVQNGDMVELFGIRDTSYLDNYGWFTQSGTKVTSLSATVDSQVELGLVGYCYTFYSCSKAETIVDRTAGIEDAQLAWVNGNTGNLTAIKNAVTDENGAVTITLPAQAGTYYLTAYIPEADITDYYATPLIMPLLPVTVYPDAAITVPSDATLFVGSKSKHFVPFTPVEAAATVTNDDGTTTYYYDLKNNSTYNYRISGADYITYAGTFKKTANYALAVTEAQLKPEGKTKTTVERDVTANNKFNVADIYLNINPAGWLRLNTGDTHQLVNLRSWEAVDSITNNYFIEPDYHYTVLGEDGRPSNSVVSVSADGLVTAKSKGTAIVLVTYDALQYANAAGGPFFGAIWPENTGVFVVTVGAEDSGIVSGMTLNAGKNSTDVKLSGDAIDAEHDVIYFTGDSGSYTFTPITAGCTISVATPTVTDSGMTFSGFRSVVANKDGSVTVPLVQGRNIVKLTKNGKSAYQVITAKKLTITTPERVAPGDPVTITFGTLYHPANKLAGVYNMSAVAVYTDVDGYEGKLIGGASNQYQFAATETAQAGDKELTRNATAWSVSYKAGAQIKVPEDWAEESFTLSGGSLIAVGFGDPYGGHRGITVDQGKSPNFNASIREAYLGQLPDITVPVTLSKTVTSISITTPPTKTTYYVGDTFDPAGMVVHSVYSDNSEKDVTNYTISPQVLAADTTAVTVSYGGKTAEVNVTVAEPAMTGLTVTNPPTKTSYTAGDVFNPTGMIVTATYENSKSAVITDYTLEPQRALQETDTAITVKLGELTATTPITVTAASAHGPDTPSNITVKFTLLGDEKHGDDGDVHTLKGGNLTSWLPQTQVTVPANSKVIDVIARALGLAGIPYENPTGNYISSVKGLKEMDNGPLSGWMYTLNGKYPDLGVAEQTLKNDDVVVFHYTDDYTQEARSESFGSSSSSSSSEPKVTVTTGTDGKPVAKVELPRNATSAVATIPTDKLGEGNVLVVVHPDGTEEILKKSLVDGETASALLNGSATVKLVDNTKSFTDTANHWAGDSIAFVTSHELFQGTSGGTFSPDAPMNRAMLATVLYRLEDAEANGGNPFTDVAAGTWYTDAVTWASANQIVSGTGSGFAPDRDLTRQELVTMLYRYAKSVGMDTDKTTDLDGYADSGNVADWAAEAMAWAVKSGLIAGRGGAVLAPEGTATRAEVATILQRLVALMVK